MRSTRAKTINGRPTSVAELSVSELKLEKESEGRQSKGLLSRLVSACNKVNLVLAGMYTGVTCYGVPHDEHSYSEQGDADSVDKKSDVSA